MTIPLLDVRQDRNNYYLQLGYSPDFYPTLAQFEQSVPRDERQYIPELGMWRVAKSVAADLPQFFPDFETFTQRSPRPVRPILSRLPYSGLFRVAAWAAVLLLVVFAWRTGRVASATQTALDRMPAPLARLLDVPAQLALASGDGGRPLDAAATAGVLTRARASRDDLVPALVRATCRGQGNPVGLVYVSAPTANLHTAPDGGSPTLDEITKGRALCVYRSQGDWQGGTVEGRDETVWVYKPLLSTTVPK